MGTKLPGSGFSAFAARVILSTCLAPAVMAHPAWSQEKSASAAGVFQPLKVGQKVSVTDKGPSGWEVLLLNDGAFGTHVVVELAPNYIVLDDLVSVSRHWIPLTAIRAVVWTRVPIGPLPKPR